MLYRYANYKNDTTAEKFSVTDFQDKDEVSEFAQGGGSLGCGQADYHR